MTPPKVEEEKDESSSEDSEDFDISVMAQEYMRMRIEAESNLRALTLVCANSSMLCFSTAEQIVDSQVGLRIIACFSQRAKVCGS